MQLIFLFAFAASALAQLPISVGIKAGFVDNRQPFSEIASLKGGPYLELSLPMLPTFETGIMFERLRLGPQTLTVYQVPILVKKRINAVAIKPFFSGGVTLRRVPTFNESHPGLTVAGGVTLGLLPIKIEPGSPLHSVVVPELQPKLPANRVPGRHPVLDGSSC